MSHGNGETPWRSSSPVVLNLLSLRTGGLSKSTQNVITTKICNSKEVWKIQFNEKFAAVCLISYVLNAVLMKLRRSRTLTSTRFLYLVLMRDNDEKLFSDRKVVQKISSNFIALSLSSGYSFLSVKAKSKIVTMASLYAWISTWYRRKAQSVILSQWR